MLSMENKIFYFTIRHQQNKNNLSVIHRTRTESNKNYFKLFYFKFVLQSSAERAAYASLHLHSNPASRGLSHGMELTHTNTHTQSPARRAIPPHTQTQNQIPPRPGSTSAASRRGFLQNRKKKAALFSFKKGDLWPFQAKSITFHPARSSCTVRGREKNFSQTFNLSFNDSIFSRSLDGPLKRKQWRQRVGVLERETDQLPVCLLPLCTATIVPASFLCNPSIVARGSAGIQFVKRDGGANPRRTTFQQSSTETHLTLVIIKIYFRSFINKLLFWFSC